MESSHYSIAHALKVLPQTIENSMSSDDLRAVCPSTRICTYKEFADFDSIDALLGHDGSCIFLYETRPNYGHWCCVFSRGSGSNKTIEMFDPYGVIPDDQLKLVAKEKRRELGQAEPHLTRLLYECPYKVEFNNHHLQENKPGVNTCGRHCCVRLAFRNDTVDAYAKRLKSAKKFNPDQVVALALPLGAAPPRSGFMASIAGSGSTAAAVMQYNFIRPHRVV